MAALLQRQRRPAAPVRPAAATTATARPPAPVRPVAPATTSVTRVIIVTSGDDTRLPVRGANRTVPQQELWRATARSLRDRSPAPGGGATAIIEVTTAEALRARLSGLAAGGAHVSRIDLVGHGGEHGFNLHGTRADERQWLGPDDLAAMLASTNVTHGASSVTVDARACYSDMWAGRLRQSLAREHLPNPAVHAVSGAYQPGWGPGAGSRTPEDESTWVVNDPGTNFDPARPVTLPADALRGL